MGVIYFRVATYPLTANITPGSFIAMGRLVSMRLLTDVNPKYDAYKSSSMNCYVVCHYLSCFLEILERKKKVFVIFKIKMFWKCGWNGEHFNICSCNISFFFFFKYKMLGFVKTHFEIPRVFISVMDRINFLKSDTPPPSIHQRVMCGFSSVNPCHAAAVSRRQVQISQNLQKYQNLGNLVTIFGISINNAFK